MPIWFTRAGGGSGGGGGVTSVNGDSGPAVVLDTDDIAEGVVNFYYTDERVDDRVATLIQDGTGLTWTYDDGANTLTGNVSLSPFSTTDLSEGTNLYFTDERVDDRVDALLTAGTALTKTYSDVGNTLTLDVDIPSVTAETTIADTDEILIYDASAAAHRRMDKSDFVDGLIDSGGNLGSGGAVFSTIAGSQMNFRTIVGAEGIDHTQNTNDITLELDTPNMTQLTTADTTDRLIIYDVSATTHKYITKDSLVGNTGNPPVYIAAEDMENPNSSDWTVNALAPLAADSNNAGLKVRLFDDTTEEGVGFTVYVPKSATNITINMISRAETAPAGTRTVGVKLYNRGIPANAAVQSWTSGTVLNDVSIPTNENFQVDNQTETLASMSITDGEWTQFELTRINPTAGTELTGDWALLKVWLEFT